MGIGLVRSLETQFQTEPGPARIGVVVFDEDATSEADLARLNAGGASAIYISRMPLSRDASAAGRARTAYDIEAAAAQLLPSGRLDAIAFSCTTGTLQLGYDAVAAAVARARPGVPLATPISGAMKAFAKLGVKRVSVVTPYGPSLNSLIVDHLQDRGIEVVQMSAFNVPDPLDIERISADSLRAGALGAAHPDAEALFISCTALRTTGLIEALEHAIGRPVITSTQAMWWEALSLTGQGAIVSGLGRLMQH